MGKGDKELLEEAIQSDLSKGFDQIFIKYYPTLLAYGSKINQDKEEVEEAIQELFLHLHQNKQLLKNIKNLKAYLFVSLRRRIIEDLKKKDKSLLPAHDKGSYVQFSREEFSSEAYVDEDRIEELRQLLNKLPWRQREAIYLKYFNGLSTKEIAEVMGSKPQTILNMVYIAFKKLRASGLSRCLAPFSLLTSFWP
ncbi:MAG: sigma-70 family RNA polymerase sigma factor [Bacteroidota bacterium]